MHPLNLLRYGLWTGIVATANANRRHYGMTTTWLPHLLTNSITLLLPDLLRLLEASGAPSSAPQAALVENVRVAGETLARTVRDPQYAVYVAPLAAGYLLSHPDFNIYKGELGELEIAGFGLDAIPHSATAFAFTALVCKAVRSANSDSGAALARLLRWGNGHAALLSGGALALATLVWELGEYRIHRHELAQRGAASAINMQWSGRDTLFDCFSNTLGWALAVTWQRRKAA